MKIKLIKGFFRCGKTLLKYVMKTFIFLCFTTMFAFSPGVILSQNAEIVIDEDKTVTVDEVFDLIRQQTEYKFIYQEDLFKNSPKVFLKKGTIKANDLLKQSLSVPDFDFTFSENTVVVAKKRTSVTFSSQFMVRGTITDEKGSPLPGVTVLLKGTKVGTTTDFDGNYEISVSTDGGILVFSYVGFATREIEVNGQAQLNITLKESAAELDEVVIIGYGTQKRSDLTGSVTTLSSESYEDQPIVSASDALQGRVAGVSVQNNSGAPGGAVKIRIRGANSVNANNDPLYVVDGVALASIGLQDININDIASMEVLKDASATAIYGSRGANGVVLITTKQGKIGKAKIEYNTFLSMNSPMYTYDLMDAPTYAQIANVTDGTDTFENPDALETTDWQKLIFQNSVTQSHQLSFSGGGDHTKYFVSGFYVDQEGLLVNTGQKKYGLRTNFNFKLSDRLDVGLNLYLSRLNSFNNEDIGGKGNPVMSAVTFDPTTSVYDENGNYNRGGKSPIWLNPYMMLKERTNNRFSNVGIFNGSLKYKITDWLTLRSSAGLNANIEKLASLNNEWLSPGNPGSGQASEENYTIQTNNVLTFHRIYDKHDVTVTGGLETTSNRVQQFNASGTGLTSLSNGYYNLGLNTSQSISSTYSNWALFSYFGRAAYGLNDKYLFTATVRRDGSSKFQGSNKWSTFPSFGIGWKLSNEEFIKNLDVFSNLKLRAGWGITGNQGVAPYGTLGLLTATTYSYGTSTLYPAYTAGNPSNPDLQWETTAQTNIGLDISLLNDRLKITADYYNKDTRDLLLSTRIPNYDGGGTLLKNVGEVNNKGFEFMVEGTIIDGDNFSWSSSINYFTNRNEVVNLGEETRLEIPLNNGLITNAVQVVEVGRPLSSFYLIPWEGVHQTATGIYQAGDAKYTDVDGNGSIGFEDRVVSGSALPKYQLGFNNNFNYKNFSLNLFLQGSYGNKIFNATYAATAVPTSDVKYMTLNDAANYWSPDNTSSTWRNPGSANKGWVESTQFLQDGSYIRLKNISLSYQIDKSVLKYLSAKVYASAQNILTFTKYKGFDPEATSTPSDSDTSGGIDLGAYPSPRTITIGAQFTF
ncbi:TonB dependent receptor [Mariniflexile rhizosphaerae]|uniref:SusC/RagA family TonB-linked outer membrane protein n=1 Tax=unclassified Mariniflexile TaxID=2643887 RepID=UPI000CA82540|nr:TonB-dependent receptor [Mariniflexile sp. TRM1-10]AXP82049.1 TonB dependent receptor [Mariniflexile sp. TRM1-10]PLB20313.1 MAG: putative outer membrane protein involved in nutrient binding [Flavobacteriaceae bacterium FS1-H7996/R]